MSETVLTCDSKASDVLECCINAVTQLSDNEYIYDDGAKTGWSIADHKDDINIRVTDARMVVTNLRSKGL